MKSYAHALPLLTVIAFPVAAQEPQCQNINAQAQAACNTMVDATKAFHPLAGMILSGGTRRQSARNANRSSRDGTGTRVTPCASSVAASVRSWLYRLDRGAKQMTDDSHPSATS